MVDKIVDLEARNEELANKNKLLVIVEGKLDTSNKQVIHLEQKLGKV